MYKKGTGNDKKEKTQEMERFARIEILVRQEHDIINTGGGHSNIGSYQGCATRMGQYFQAKNLRMGVNF